MTDTQPYKYSRPSAPPPPGSPHALILEHVPLGSKVLDLGSGPGYLAHFLGERGCKVTCVEADPEACAAAAGVCTRALSLDLNDQGWAGRIDETFDVVVMADVLEHLTDPAQVLRSARALLDPAGRLVVSVPNVAHGSVRLPLFLGEWSYENQGLLDDTHLRFFTQSHLFSLLSEAGFQLTSVESVVRATHPSLVIQVATRLGVPDDQVRRLLSATNGDTFQIVAVAEPAKPVASIAKPDGTVANSVDLYLRIRQLETHGAVLEAQVTRLRRVLRPVIFANRLRRLRPSAAKQEVLRVKEVGREKGYTYLLRRALHMALLARGCNSPAVYAEWIAKCERRPTSLADYGFQLLPLISVIVPVYNTDPSLLRACVCSVEQQLYPHWQLRIHDDGSTSFDTIDVLRELTARNDPRISVTSSTNRGISAASNAALDGANGQFIVLLDHDDVLAPHALAEVAQVINQTPTADIIYSDEDKLDQTGTRISPYFKADWSPDLALSQMYVGHLSAYRSELVLRVGGFRIGYEGSQDHDLLLRCMDETRPERIVHIPKVLYHWRMTQKSTALDPTAKSYTENASLRALEDHLSRNAIQGDVLRGQAPNTYRVRYAIAGSPLVSIIVPFRDKPEMLNNCVSSIIKKTDYENFEILLLDNDSHEDGTFKVIEALTSDDRVRVESFPGAFNFSAINNFGADKARGEHLLLLNNDTEPIESEWLRAMLEHSQRSEVGVVGAKLLYPTNRIQHAGVIIGLGGVAGHAFLDLHDIDPGYFSLPLVVHDCSAVTAACLMVRKDVYHAVGGLDARNLTVAFNDVDLCLKIRKRGLRVVYTPYAKLYHLESATRGCDDDLRVSDPVAHRRVMQERDFMRSTWREMIENDPYYNPNLSKRGRDYCPNIERMGLADMLWGSLRLVR